MNYALLLTFKKVFLFYQYKRSLTFNGIKIIIKEYFHKNFCLNEVRVAWFLKPTNKLIRNQ